ncbi:helix-turn-helix domain-containing protein [Streptomyces sp. NPDC086776]|uniref:helix-turn-helix domain-containing protein n=1 Tax=Streptomyces sp. NPDC086776 TaxID=3365756 RepID=UPI0038214F75
MSSSTPRLATKYRPRLKDKERSRKRRDLAEAYRAGASIRSLATWMDMSYGTARTLLLEANVKLRGRGGARVTPKASDQ